ncbi:hypothetical protein [Kutzneria sp. CA-103260]|uniref:hypothetical protein n=1 Tax=Kutzneria sp. CA-103260 TaxID=2802641 RepID=UPI001BA46AE9|nr:hypothetical protein [Kutzneria sp. CA-103260]QUQ66352.1 hypothetical protein JJ691_40790 [Kutzneria sp. CA-103260]
MRLTTLGGGFRDPLAHKALLADNTVTSLVPHDVDERIAVAEGVALRLFDRYVEEHLELAHLRRP